jgi:L-iditol 2-dehydrogenase
VVTVDELPDPVAGPGEELVRVTGVGLCGSDLHWFEDGGIGDAKLERPLVLGHEIGGVIASGPSAGQRVAVDPAIPCERCGPCLADHANLCTAIRFAGHGVTDGALRELMAWPRALLQPVPESLGDAEVPVLEPLGVGLHAIDLAHFRPGMRAGVYGCGPIGLLLVAALRALGAADVVATDPLPHRREAALSMGASRAWGVDDVGFSAEAGQEMVDVAFEAAGDDGALATALTAVEIGGRVVVAGIPPSDITMFTASLARRKGLSIILSRRMKARHLVRAISLAEHGLVSLAPVISARYRLSDGHAAFEALVRREGLKIVVDPSA